MVEFEYGKWKLVWEFIGEGLSGDYDPKDPKDVKLLRATLSYDGRDLHDSSYCTMAPHGTKENKLRKLSKKLFSKLPEAPDNDGYWQDRIMQLWTSNTSP